MKGISRAPPLHGAWPQWVGVPDKPASPPPHCPLLPLGIPGPWPLKPRPGGTEEGRVFRTARRTWSRIGLRGSPPGLSLQGRHSTWGPLGRAPGPEPARVVHSPLLRLLQPQGPLRVALPALRGPLPEDLPEPPRPVPARRLWPGRCAAALLVWAGPCWGDGGWGQGLSWGSWDPRPGWVAPDPSWCFCGHSLKLPTAWWGPGLGTESRRG